MINNRKFKIWAYTVSHNTLFLRSEMQYPDLNYEYVYTPNCTIDIEFVGVTYIQLESEVIIKSIEVAEKGAYLEIGQKVEQNQKIFVLSHSSGKSFVIAESCVIGRSEWINEHRLINPMLEYPFIIDTL